MWNEERVELCVKLWGQGYSASQVANRLGGVTRNAVIGKLHRLGKAGTAPRSRGGVTKHRQHPAKMFSFGSAAKAWTFNDIDALREMWAQNVELVDIATRLGRSKAAVATRARDLALPSRKFVAKAQVLMPLPPEPKRPAKLISFEDLTDKTCRFIYGDPGGKDWGFCTCEKLPGSSYCPGHHGKLTAGPVPRRRHLHPVGAMSKKITSVAFEEAL